VYTSEGLTTRAIRLDDRAEWARAVEILVQAIPEIPHFRWLMGDLMSPPLVRWLAEVVLSPARTEGVHGTFDESGELCAVVVWSAPDHPAYAPDPELIAKGAELFGRDAGFVARYRESQEADAETWSVPGALNISIAAVASDYRRRGILSATVAPVVEESIRRNVPGVIRTGTRDLADAYARLFAAVELGSYKLSDGSTVWVLEVPVGGRARSPH
jgi:hypothetical protein